MTQQYNEQLVDLLQEGINYASKKTDQVEFLSSKSNSFSLNVDNGRIDKYNIADSQVLGVRVIANNRVGISYTENINKDSIQEIVDNAIENSTFMKEDKFQRISNPGNESKLINTHDKNFQEDATSTEEKIKLGIALEQKIKEKDSRVKNAPYNGFNESVGESYLLNSSGLFTFERSKAFSCYTSCLMEEGDKNSLHYHASQSRNFKGLNVDECVEESYLHAKELLHAGPIKSGNYDIIFKTDVLESLFSAFSIIYSGKSTVEKKNPFKDKLEKEVATNLLTVRDLPHYKDAFSYNLFDSEGTPHQDLTLMKNGVLKSFYHNSASSRELGQENTGHASRSPKGQLGISPTNIVIDAGNTNETKLVADPYLEILFIDGLHSGATPISGDFSFAITGYYHHNGSRKPFKGVTLSGNFYQILNQIGALGDQVHTSTSQSFFSPLIRFKNLRASGL